MEISLLANNSVKIKGKHAALLIDPQEKTVYNAGILFSKKRNEVKVIIDAVLLDGPGEYEVGGIKIKGTGNRPDVSYSIIIDGIEILLGKLEILEKMQHKLQDHNIVLVYCANVLSSSFLTSLASNAVIFYGEKAGEVSQVFGKEKTNRMQKFTATLDKLPAELDTILLA